MREVTVNDIHKESNKLEIFLFNVGQGDHILLKFPGLEYGIIDFFYDSSIENVEPPCLSYFKQLKNTLQESDFEKVTISFFCISHTDKDHVKGISETIEWFHNNKVFIKEFWLSAARDEFQFNNYLKELIPSLINSLGFYKRIEFSNQIDRYSEGVEKFFIFFEKWKNKDFNSIRYSKEETGTGDYLVDIKTLRKPSCDSIAFNIGPLDTQLEHYYRSLSKDLILNILGIQKDHHDVNKNLLSHILCIKF
jgi:hypothetical protein